MSFKATLKSKVVSGNDIIQKDGYTSIRFENIGIDNAILNDNIPLPAGKIKFWENQPGVIIDENSLIRFENISADKRVLVEMFYIKIN